MNEILKEHLEKVNGTAGTSTGLDFLQLKHESGNYYAANTYLIALKELAALRARVEAAEAKVAKLFTSDAQSVDEFNAGYQAFEAGMDLDTAEQNYYSVLPDDVPHHDSFGTGYAWAKFVT